MRNTHMSQFIPPASIQKSAGTWTPTLAGDLVSDVRTAAAATFNLFIPIPIPSNSEYRAGAKLKRVKLLFAITVGALTGFATVALKRLNLFADGSAVTGTAVATTLDAGNDTAAERVAVGSHTMTVTLDTPVYVDDGQAFVLYCAAEGAANTVFALLGAVAEYELKLQ